MYFRINLFTKKFTLVFASFAFSWIALSRTSSSLTVLVTFLGILDNSVGV
jgi:hypothetical protein